MGLAPTSRGAIQSMQDTHTESVGLPGQGCASYRLQGRWLPGHGLSQGTREFKILKMDPLPSFSDPLLMMAKERGARLQQELSEDSALTGMV